MKTPIRAKGAQDGYLRPLLRFLAVGRLLQSVASHRRPQTDNRLHWNTENNPNAPQFFTQLPVVYVMCLCLLLQLIITIMNH